MNKPYQYFTPQDQSQAGEALKALQDLNDAFDRLQRLWQHTPAGYILDQFTGNDYPFDENVVELYPKIEQWTDHSRRSILMEFPNLLIPQQ
jgi:hypothetical protein